MILLPTGHADVLKNFYVGWIGVACPAPTCTPSENQVSAFLRQVLRLEVHSGQRNKSCGFKTIPYLAGLYKNLPVHFAN